MLAPCTGGLRLSLCKAANVATCRLKTTHERISNDHLLPTNCFGLRLVDRNCDIQHHG